jgi:hypothetical protein
MPTFVTHISKSACTLALGFNHSLGLWPALSPLALAWVVFYFHLCLSLYLDLIISIQVYCLALRVKTVKINYIFKMLFYEHNDLHIDQMPVTIWRE